MSVLIEFIAPILMEVVLAWLAYSFVSLPLETLLGTIPAETGRQYGEVPVIPAVEAPIEWPQRLRTSPTHFLAHWRPVHAG